MKMMIVTMLIVCSFLQAQSELIRTSETKISYIPFFRLYTPNDIRAEADFTVTPDSVTTTELRYTTAGTTNGRLFKLPLVPANILQSSADVVAVITIGLESGVRNRDSDPKFFLSDGRRGIGFEMREEGVRDRCRGIQATMGDTFTSSRTFSGVTHTSTILPEEFVISIKPRRRWGSCFTAIDSGLISPIGYTSSISPCQGLWLEVYRENTNEQYTINYIKVDIHESL
ncbi:uncharacterized protein [Dysidea avara]|uniref:uncharacterized protein n=1 Tax=Dysidea avara TaxID=196820 RepID=UPI0033176B07